MAQLLASLLPLIIGACLGGPAWIIMTLILLRGENGVSKAAAFASGSLTMRVLQFILFGYIFGVAIDTGGHEAFHLIPPTLLLVAGILLLATAARTWWRQEEDSDAPRPGWIAALGGVPAITAFGMAMLMMLVAMKQWVFTLSAIAIIDNAHFGKTKTILAYLFFMLGAQSLMLAPIVGSVIAPSPAAQIVATMLSWLERKSRLITIFVSLLFGAWFFSKGVSGFLSHVEELSTVAIPATH
jgi:hypothetical protein